MTTSDRARLDRTRLLWVLRVGFSVIVAGFVVVVAVDAVSDLSSVRLRVDAVWLTIAYPLGLAAFPLLALGWAELLHAYGHRLTGPTAVRLWALAQASRYIPTGLAAVASRAVLANRLGVPRSLTVTTMVVEGGLLVAWSSLAGGALLLAGGHQEVIPVALLGAAALIALPTLLVVAGRAAAGRAAPGRLILLVTKITHQPGPPAVRPLVGATLIVGFNMAVKAAVFVLLARTLLPVRADDTALLVGAVNLAVIVGMIGITPAGIGVREGALIALLSGRFGGADATALALALRVWDLSVELPWVGVAVVANRLRPATLRPG